MRSQPTPWLRRSVLLANGLALLVGLILVVIAASLSSQTVLWTIAGVIGGALVSATVVTFTLGGISLTETITQVDSALLRGLQSVLSPVRETAQRVGTAAEDHQDGARAGSGGRGEHLVKHRGLVAGEAKVGGVVAFAGKGVT